jgi:lipoate-protein ligase A
MDGEINLFYESPSHDPYYNLALEQHLFDMGKPLFMLWQNDNTVVIGKNQNAEAEINRPFIKERGITVARRLSGGGAVYHDLGNLNFTFILNDSGANGTRQPFEYYCLPVIKTLAGFGVRAEAHGRNDILVDGRKFSGNAQYRKNGMIMHHGTIMFSSDLETVQSALSPPESKLRAKGVKSIRSRVTTLIEHLPQGVTLEAFKESFKTNVLPAAYGVFIPTADDLAEIGRLRESLYSTWQWNFGMSPRYNISKKKRVENCGTLEFYLDVNNGKIENIECFGDYFGDKPFSEMANLLIGCELRENAVLAAVGNINVNDYFHNLSNEMFAKIITGE